MLGSDYKEEDIPHRLYFVNDADALAQRHASAQIPLLAVPQQNLSRHTCACATRACSVVCGNHLITPKSTLSRLLFIHTFAIIATICLFTQSTLHYGDSTSIWTEWMRIHPYALISTHIGMTVIAFPFSFITVIGCAYAYFLQFGISGVAVSTMLSSLSHCSD